MGQHRSHVAAEDPAEEPRAAAVVVDALVERLQRARETDALAALRDRMAAGFEKAVSGAGLPAVLQGQGRKVRFMAKQEIFDHKVCLTSIGKVRPGWRRSGYATVV